MGEDHVAVERVLVLDASVLDDFVRDGVLVVTLEVTAAPWAGQLVHHPRMVGVELSPQSAGLVCRSGSAANAAAQRRLQNQ